VGCGFNGVDGDGSAVTSLLSNSGYRVRGTRCYYATLEVECLDEKSHEEIQRVRSCAE
jgi:hypothetical protein